MNQYMTPQQYHDLRSKYRMPIEPPSSIGVVSYRNFPVVYMPEGFFIIFEGCEWCGSNPGHFDSEKLCCGRCGAPMTASKPFEPIALN